MFKVLIACFSNWETASEMPHLLKRAGCTVDVYCSANSWLKSNSFYDNWIECGSGNAQYKEQLFELVNNSDYQWVILGDDELIKFMNEEIETEELFMKIMPITKIENRRMLSSKQGLSDFCIANGIDTPGYFMYNGKEDLEQIKTKLHFPVINKLDFSYGGTDMFISNSYEDFLAELHKIPENKNVLIQEFITGEEIPVEGLFYKGELVTYLSANVLEYSTTNFSYTTRKKYYDNQALKPILTDLGRKLGLSGFANMLYLYDKHRDLYFLIEVDPRPNSWIPYGRFIASNDFIAGVKRIISGEYKNGYQEMGMKKPFVEVGLFYKDFRRALWQKDKKGIARWLFNINGYWRFIPFYDLKLLKKIIIEIWKQIVVVKWKNLFKKIG